MRLRFRSILARTALILFVSAGITGTVFIVLAASLIADRFHHQAHNRLGELIDTVERTVSIACYLSDKSLAGEVTQGLMKNMEITSIVILDANQKAHRQHNDNKHHDRPQTSWPFVVAVFSHNTNKLRQGTPY